MSGKTGYWQRYLKPRLNRRRLLSVAVAGTAAAAVAACGGSATPEGDDDQLSSLLLRQPEDTSANAKQGGTLKSVAIADIPSFDPHSASNTVVATQVAAYTYPRLLKFATAKFPGRPEGGVEGDLAESYELSGDRLQLTFRLRQGLRWENKAPVNGRAIDAQDVVASWNRFLRLSPFRHELAYDPALAPGSPVESVSSPDSRTVVVRLKQPDATVPALFASERLFYVLPREADGGFDPRFEPRGYGPMRLAENRPGTFRVWTRNPDYFVKGRPFIDTVELPVIGDYQARIAQFKAGNIWTHVAAQGDILGMKEEMPYLRMQKADNFSTNPSSLAFGYEGDSPWKDERLRQAVSMLIDRETIIDFQTHRERFHNQGVEFEVRYHTAVGAGWEGYWIDPRYEGIFGENARYFRYDPEEATKLVRAAGFMDGLDAAFHFNGGYQYGLMYARTVELLSGMLAEGNIRLRLEPHDYAADWLPNYQFPYAQAQNAGKPIKGFDGLVYRISTVHPSPATQLFSQFHKDGLRFEGMTPDGKNAHLGDAEINNLAAAIKREFDLKKQQQMAQDFSRLMAKKAYVIPNLPFAAPGFTLTWPVIGNYGLWRGWPSGSVIAEGALQWWLDTSKPPLTPAPTPTP